MQTQKTKTEHNIFVARQPIFNRKEKVYAYELLFRSDQANNFFDTAVTDEKATSNVISNSFFLMGINRVTQGKKAFINFSDQLLIKEYPLLCDKDITVIEVLETATISPSLIDACRKFTQRGFKIALDDFIYTESWQPLMQLAHIIKLDVLAMDMDELSRQVENARQFNVKLLAEKVEDHGVYQKTMDMGFDYFQGYFFSKPNILSGRDIPVNKLHLLKVLNMLNDRNMDFIKLGRIVAEDVSLSYKLLKLVNSAWLYLPNKVESLPNAVAMLGEDNFRKFASLITLSSMADDKPSELTRMAVFRANFCEEVGKLMPKLPKKNGICYTIGMFSLLDALLDKPMKEILQELALSDSVCNALLGKNRDLYAAPLLLLNAWEQGLWQNVTILSKKMQINQQDLPAIFDKCLDTVENFQTAV